MIQASRVPHTVCTTERLTLPHVNVGDTVCVWIAVMS